MDILGYVAGFVVGFKTFTFQVVNAGKSQTIEDQALAAHNMLTRDGDSLPYTGNM